MPADLGLATTIHVSETSLEASRAGTATPQSLIELPSVSKSKLTSDLTGCAVLWSFAVRDGDARALGSKGDETYYGHLQVALEIGCVYPYTYSYVRSMLIQMLRYPC